LISWGYASTENQNQFVYVADTSRRAEKIGLALNDSEPCIVSSIYTVFEVKDKEELIPRNTTK
jgi:type I restriction enzyme S subunit